MYKIVVSILICISLVIGQSVSVSSAPSSDRKPVTTVAKSQTKRTAVKKQSRRPKQKRETISTKSVKAPGSINISADAAVLIDAASGQVLFDRQAHKHRQPASTTKIMTAILALEYGDLDQIVTVSDKAAKVGQATIHLKPGEKISLRDLIEGALIKSGNDACVAIAENIAGDEMSFVNMMNTKARVLGAYDTNFENTNGLPNSKHYSSAYDLALMARYGMQLPLFADITRTKEAEIESIEPKSTLPVRNTNKLLWIYEFADGVKTGTTNAAGKCLVASATKNGRQLIAAVLDAPGRFQDCVKLLEYGFNNFEPIKLAEAGDEAAKFIVYEANVKEVPVVYGNAIEFLLKPGESSQVERQIIWSKPQIAPIWAGEQLGEVQYRLKGQLVAQSPVYATIAAKHKNFIKRLISNNQ